MAKRKNAAGLTNDVQFYARPDLETFQERLDIAVKHQLEAIKKDPKSQEKNNFFKLKFEEREDVAKIFELLRLGTPVVFNLQKYQPLYLKAQNIVTVAAQEARAAKEARTKKREDEARRKAEDEARRKAEDEARRKAEDEARAKKAREREDDKLQKDIERGLAMKRRPRWLYWLIREQRAKQREHENYMQAGRVALAMSKRIQTLQTKIWNFLSPFINAAATLKTTLARLIWRNENWTPQERTRYNWRMRQDLIEEIEANPDGIVTQDPEEAARDARRKTRARRITHAQAIDRGLEIVARELRNDVQNAVRSSLEESYKKAYADILDELQETRRAINADEEQATRIALARDLTTTRKPAAPEMRIPQNMPRLGNYGESVIFNTPSPDQIKAALNAEFFGADYSTRIWKDTEKLAQNLKNMMEAAIINGEHSQTVAKKLSSIMGVEASHCERLIRTEQSRILNQAAIDSMRNNGAEEYIFIAIEDQKTCTRCKRLNGKKFKLTAKRTGLNFPPMHPHCRCHIISHYAWEDDDDTPPSMTPGTQSDDPFSQWLRDAEKILDEKAQKDIETARRVIDDEDEARREIEAAAQAQDDAMKRDEQRIKTAIGIQKRAIAQGKPIKEAKTQGKDAEKRQADSDRGGSQCKPQKG